jgi:eukaryotic-like serine/threonine-protein kinase
MSRSRSLTKRFPTVSSAKPAPPPPLNHSNIGQLYDIGSNYLVMELVEGTPIAPLDDMRRLLDLAIQIADGPAAAHAAGLLHRDLNPDNILVTGPASAHPNRVKILDFGLAKSATASDADVRQSYRLAPGRRRLVARRQRES